MASPGFRLAYQLSRSVDGGERVTLRVRLASGEHVQDLHLEPLQTALHAKRALSNPTATPAGRMQLLHGGRSLADHSTLAAQGVGQGLVEIQLVRRFETAPSTERAAQVGDAVLMAYMLECRADPNKKRRMGRTALHWAAGRGDLAICRLLLQCDDLISINDTDFTGQTALHSAACAGSTAVCEAILGDARFRAADRSDGHGRTALHLAAARGHASVCRSLLASSKFVARDTVDQELQTALDLAIACRHAETCLALTETDC